MPESSLARVLMQITDGHPADAAEAARRPAESDRFSSAERVVLVALLRHAREKSLKQRVFGAAGPVGPEAAAARAAMATESYYPLPARETAGNQV
jgi:hypothetical protein